MKIGIDLDGVCYDFTGAFCRYVGWDPATANKWEFFKDHGWSSLMFLRTCRIAVKDGELFATGDLLPGTKEAFDALIEMGHTIHIVTDRTSLDPDDTDLIVRYTRDWLEDNGLRYETIHFTGDKVTVAQELGLSFFIDDKVENVQALLDAGFKAYLADQPWNRHAPHLPRISTWEQFVEGVRLYDAVKRPTYRPLVFGETSNGDPVEVPNLEDSLEKFRVEEVRVTSETGGQKGQKLARLGSLDPRALMEVAKVAGFGEQKYSRLNYMKGYDWSLTYDACQRHLHAFWSGEDTDPESGLPHLAHAAWHCLTMLAFLIHELGTDDRYRKPGEEAA